METRAWRAWGEMIISLSGAAKLSGSLQEAGDGAVSSQVIFLLWDILTGSLS